MDHKEFLDDVINDMASDATENEDMDNSIQLKMSTGEVYLVDPNTFDWNKAVMNLPQMIENESALCSIMFSLLNVTDPTTEDSVKFIKHTIEQLEDFMGNLQVHPRYENFDPNISDYKKATFMVFDAMNVVQIMNHHTKMFEAMSILSSMNAHECHCDCCNHEEDSSEEKKILRVVGVTDEQYNVKIVDYEGSDCPPDKIGIPEYDDDGNMVVFVCCRNTDEGLKEAHEIFVHME